jgi:hypothetical protein
MAETWLRIVTYRTSPGSDDGRRYVTDGLQRVQREFGRTLGFRGGHWAHDADGEILAAVTNWASREAIEEASDFLRMLRADRLAHGLTLDKEVNLQLVTAPTAWEPADWQAITSRHASNWLRVAFYGTQDAGDAQSADYLRSSTRDAMAMLKQQAGFRVGYWGHDPVGGTMAAITYWDGLEEIVQAAPELQRLQQERREHGGTITEVLNLRLLSTELVHAGATGWLS